ncbi:hypothetical protein [Kaarinaea lacus]
MKIIQYRHNILQKWNAQDISTPMILCIAAILGSICNFIAVTKVHTAYNNDAGHPSETLLIIPASAQKQVALPLPGKPPLKAAL